MLNNLGLSAVLVILIVVFGYLVLRARRLFAILLALDHYLMDLAIMSAADHHRATYFAWHKTMGEIEVQVKSGRYHWDHDEEWERAKRR